METCSLNRRRWKAIITQPVRAQQGSQGTANSPEWNPGNRKPYREQEETEKRRKEGSTVPSLECSYLEIEGILQIFLSQAVLFEYGLQLRLQCGGRSLQSFCLLKSAFKINVKQISDLIYSQEFDCNFTLLMFIDRKQPATLSTVASQPLIVLVGSLISKLGCFS